MQLRHKEKELVLTYRSKQWRYMYMPDTKKNLLIYMNYIIRL